MTDGEKEEVRLLIEITYMPLALKNERYNGKDFLTTAFSLMDTLRLENPNLDRRGSAKIMVDFFNSKLDPKMHPLQHNGYIKFLSEGRKEILNFMGNF
jgi:hypothetical protein